MGWSIVYTKWAESSEFVSSSIPSWQILTAHAQPFRGARDLAFCLRFLLTHCLYEQAAEVLARLRGCAGSPEPSLLGERGGSVVECRTPEREVGGSKPTAAVLCPWARHFTPQKYWLITQEAVAPSRHDWKIVDWDVKPQHKQTFAARIGDKYQICLTRPKYKQPEYTCSFIFFFFLSFQSRLKTCIDPQNCFNISLMAMAGGMWALLTGCYIFCTLHT